jgi:L-erythro-3,5-diaminohexanoate dehydrogenase
VTSGDRVVVLGAGGKSGLLCCAEARRRVGHEGAVVGIEANPQYAGDLSTLGLCDRVIHLDATEALRVREAVVGALGREADLTISCVNVPGAEPTAILLTRPRGRVYFFAMSTSFTAAALGAEGMGKDIDMYIGNGYAEGHAEHTLELVRSAPPLRDILARRYA